MVVSGNGDDTVRDICIRYGADAFFAKPMNLNELFTQIERLVLKRSEEQAI